MRCPTLCAGVVALLLVSAVGCSHGSDPLDGTTWRLSEWTLSSLSPADFTITAAFADGQMSGRSGVNRYGGPYTLGSDHAFAVRQLSSTEMAGPEPAMRAESAYMKLLGQARSYRLGKGRLTLLDGGANESLIFRAVGG
jgi:heat shock protein HslJ